MRRFLSNYFDLLLEFRVNYSATSNNMKLVHWLLMGGLLHLVQRGGAWAGLQPTQAPLRCTKCNSPPINGQCIPITVLLYKGPLLCGLNVVIKGLKGRSGRERSTFRRLALEHKQVVKVI